MSFLSYRVRRGIRTVTEAGHSMQPTITAGSQVRIDTSAYLDGRLPQRGHVIAFHPPLRGPGADKVFLKRVVAIPGDLIKIGDGRRAAYAELRSASLISAHEHMKLLETVPAGVVRVNGQRLDDSWPCSGASCQRQFCRMELGQDEYCVLGD